MLFVSIDLILRRLMNKRRGRRGGLVNRFSISNRSFSKIKLRPKQLT